MADKNHLIMTGVSVGGAPHPLSHMAERFPPKLFARRIFTLMLSKLSRKRNALLRRFVSVLPVRHPLVQIKIHFDRQPGLP